VATSTTPKTVEELAELIDSFTKCTTSNPEDGYQQSADAMWKAAVAAFNFAASEVGATGFQASWAALQFYKEAMHVKGPFMIVKVDDALYPQYDLSGRVENFVGEHREYLREKARDLLEEAEAQEDKYVHPEVLAHWKKLVGDDE
jgi:hypothetical protein